MRDLTPPRRRRRGLLDWSTGVIGLIMLSAAVTVYVRDGQERFLAVLLGDVALFGGILPKVLAGCLIGAFVTLLPPRERVVRAIGGDSGITGLLIATLCGVLLPGGPYTAYPVAAALLMAGADAGAAVAFITSWTLLGYSRALVWELPFMGPDFVMWRVVLSLPFPVLLGIAARAVVRACPGLWNSRA